MTEPVDDRIREHMRDSFPGGQRSSVVLEELRPQMIRARNRRRAVQTSAGLATVSAIVIGVLLVIPQLGGSSSELDVAGPEDSGTVVDSTSLESPATTDALGRTIEEPSQQSPDVAPSSSTLPREPSTTIEPSTTVEPPTTVAPTTTVTTTQPSTSAAPTTTEGTTTSTAKPATTTTTTPTPGLITTPCGSLVVEIVGSGIVLVSTDPDPGFEVEVKDPGPDRIEVGFEGEGLPHCEVVVENRDGQIWSDVRDEND